VVCIRNLLVIIVSVKTSFLLLLFALRVKMASVVVLHLLVQVAILEFVLNTPFDQVF